MRRSASVGPARPPLSFGEQRMQGVAEETNIDVRRFAILTGHPKTAHVVSFFTGQLLARADLNNSRRVGELHTPEQRQA
jgi:hypothetical protein